MIRRAPQSTTAGTFLLYARSWTAASVPSHVQCRPESAGRRRKSCALPLCGHCWTRCRLPAAQAVAVTRVCHLILACDKGFPTRMPRFGCRPTHPCIGTRRSIPSGSCRPCHHRGVLSPLIPSVGSGHSRIATEPERSGSFWGSRVPGVWWRCGRLCRQTTPVAAVQRSRRLLVGCRRV